MHAVESAEIETAAAFAAPVFDIGTIAAWCPAHTLRQSTPSAKLRMPLFHHYRLADVHVPIASDDPEVTVATILTHPLFK